jgi:hypothetical protein
MQPFEPDPAKVEHLLDSVPVTYAILDETLYGKPADPTQYARPAVLRAPNRWRRLYSDREGKLMIYQRVREAADGPAAN